MSLSIRLATAIALAGMAFGAQQVPANAVPVNAATVPWAPTIIVPAAPAGDRAPSPPPNRPGKAMPKPAAAHIVLGIGAFHVAKAIAPYAHNAAGQVVRNSPAVYRQLQSIYKWKR